MYFRLLFQSLRYRALTWVLNLCLVAFSCACAIIFLLLQKELERQALANASRVNLILAAKGSAIQVLASTMYFLESPTGNLPLALVADKLSHPLLEKVVPISLGDSYMNYQIVGTTEDFAYLYKGKLEQGSFWRGSMQAVVGASVPLSLGSHFEGSHGEDHHHEPFEVVGKLAATGTVLDRLILTDTASYLELHHSTQSAVTAFYLKYKGSKAATVLPSYLAKIPDVEVVSPLLELTSLARKLDWLGWVVYGLALFLMLGAGLAIGISLLNTLKYEMADYGFLRLCGASRRFVSAVLLGEVATASSLGFLFGAFLSRMILAGAMKAYIGVWPSDLWWIPMTEEGYLLGFVVLVSIFAAVVPAWRIYSSSLAKVL